MCFDNRMRGIDCVIQLFLASRAIYVIAFNLTRLATSAEACSRVRYWLHIIHTHTATAPIILVGTHLDEVGNDVLM